MKLHIWGILVVFLFFAGASYAQQASHVQRGTDAHLTGHVLDAQTKEHLPFVTIAIKGTTLGTASDATGHFLMKNLPVGRQTLVASYLGYQAVEQEVLVESNKTIEIKLTLRPQALQMDEVVVTGTRNETNKRESATIVNVISTKLFEKTASNNVAEVLNFQPGLRVEYNCSNCGVPQLRINGLEGQYSQILLDSRPIFSSLATVYGLEQLPAGMIERVEVIRGGGSALFGSNAIGGVVNIITKEPLRNSATLSNNTAFFQGGGTDINTTLNGSFVTDDNKAGIYLFGMVKNHSAYDRDNDGFSEIPNVESETVGFRGFYKLSPSSRLTAEYHHIREFRRGGNLMDRPPHEADIAEQLRHSINGGGLKYDFFSKDTKHRVSLYSSLQYIDRDSYFGTNKNPDAYGVTTDMTLIAGGQYAYSMDRLLFMPAQLTVGAEYTNNKLNDQMLGYNREIEQRSLCYGTFLQNEWKNEQLSILLGGRLDKHNKVASPIFSPRVNVRYTPITDIGLRASYSSGYRAPQAYEEDLHVAAVGGEVAIISVSPDLRPEYSQSVSGSVDWYHRFDGIETNILVEGFYTNLKDVFTLQEKGHDADGNLLLERRNASGATIKGVNLEMKVAFSPKLIIDAGYTWQRSRYKELHTWSENTALAPQRRMFRAPDNYGYLTLNYLPTKHFSASVSANHTGSMLVQHYAGYVAQDTEKRTPNFFDLALRLSYEFNLSAQLKLQLSGGVKNLLDAFQRDIDQGMQRDAGYIYGPAAPRTYYAGVKLAF
ncbi:MAG: TonB-dependent receptor [Tannerellaceae bacterium]